MQNKSQDVRMPSNRNGEQPGRTTGVVPFIFAGVVVAATIIAMLVFFLTSS